MPSLSSMRQRLLLVNLLIVTICSSLSKTHMRLSWMLLTMVIHVVGDSRWRHGIPATFSRRYHRKSAIGVGEGEVFVISSVVPLRLAHILVISRVIATVVLAVVAVEALVLVDVAVDEVIVRTCARRTRTSRPFGSHVKATTSSRAFLCQHAVIA